MPTALTTGLKTAPGSYPGTIAPNGADMVFEAGDVAGNTFVASGDDLILVLNSDPTNPYTVTISSEIDPINNRLGDITAYSLAAGDYAVFGPFETQGWADTTSGLILLTVSNVAVKVCVIKLVN